MRRFSSSLSCFLPLFLDVFTKTTIKTVPVVWWLASFGNCAQNVASSAPARARTLLLSGCLPSGSDSRNKRQSIKSIYFPVLSLFCGLPSGYRSPSPPPPPLPTNHLSSLPTALEVGLARVPSRAARDKFGKYVEFKNSWKKNEKDDTEGRPYLNDASRSRPVPHRESPVFVDQATRDRNDPIPCHKLVVHLCSFKTTRSERSHELRHRSFRPKLGVASHCRVAYVQSPIVTVFICLIRMYVPSRTASHIRRRRHGRDPHRGSITLPKLLPLGRRRSRSS